MKALVVGLGSIGSRHARNLKALGVDEVIGMDPTPERRARFASELGGAAFADLASATAQPPGLAIIASPNRFHVSQALACAQAGIPMLIEKPLSHSREDVETLIAETERRALFVHVGSNWKFHPAFQLMKRLVAEDRIGRIVGAQVLAGQWLPDWHPWEDYRKGYSARADLGGGIVLDSHELDYLTWLLGPARAILGATVRTGALDIDTEDVAAACLMLESGALATLQFDYIQRQPRRRYHLTGIDGTIEWDLQAAAVDVYLATTKSTERLAMPLGDLNDMYLDQTRHVLAALRDGTPPVTPLRQAATVLDLQLAWKRGGG